MLLKIASDIDDSILFANVTDHGTVMNIKHLRSI